MFDKFTIEDIDERHFDGVQRLEQELHVEEPFREQDLVEMFVLNEGAYTTYKGSVAILDDEIVGYMVYLEGKIGSFKMANLFRVGVTKKLRRSGIGTLLLDSIEVKNGAEIEVEVGEERYDQAKFFRENGFVVIRIEEDEIDDEGNIVIPACFVMKKPQAKNKIELSERLDWRVQ